MLRKSEKLTADEVELIAIIDIALSKMPNYEGNLQRSLFFTDQEAVQNFLKDYVIGQPVIYKEFLSTTKGEIYNPKGQAQIFIQDAKKGKDISKLNGNEQEVLFNRDVINVVEKDGKYYILLEEKERVKN